MFKIYNKLKKIAESNDKFVGNKKHLRDKQKENNIFGINSPAKKCQKMTAVDLEQYISNNSDVPKNILVKDLFEKEVYFENFFKRLDDSFNPNNLLDYEPLEPNFKLDSIKLEMSSKGRIFGLTEYKNAPSSLYNYNKDYKAFCYNEYCLEIYQELYHKVFWQYYDVKIVELFTSKYESIPGLFGVVVFGRLLDNRWVDLFKDLGLEVIESKRDIYQWSFSSCYINAEGHSLVSENNEFYYSILKQNPKQNHKGDFEKIVKSSQKYISKVDIKNPLNIENLALLKKFMDFDFESTQSDPVISKMQDIRKVKFKLVENQLISKFDKHKVVIKYKGMGQFWLSFYLNGSDKALRNRGAEPREPFTRLDTFIFDITTGESRHDSSGTYDNRYCEDFTYLIKTFYIEILKQNLDHEIDQVESNENIYKILYTEKTNYME